MKRQIYLDHAATTPVDPRVLRGDAAVFLGEFWQCVGGVFDLAGEPGCALEEAREKVAEILGCSPDEVIFTGGATEADNAAIAGAALGQRESGDHIVTSAIEHHAVLHACESLGDFGFETTYLGVDEFGTVEPEQVAEAVNERTNVVSIMLANNEVGTIEPIAEIGVGGEGEGGSGSREEGSVPHGCGAGRGGTGPECRQAGCGHADAGGAQVLRPEGGRDSVRPQRHTVPAVPVRGEPGGEPPGGDGEHPVDSRGGGGVEAGGGGAGGEQRALQGS